MADAFSGYGICELPVGEAALNTISYIRGLPVHDSFHPNAIGQLLMANRIETVLRGAGIDIPAATTTGSKTSTTRPSTLVPQPATIAAQPDSSPCHARRPTSTRYPVTTRTISNIALTGTRANATACYRINNGTWRRALASAAGSLNLSAPTSSKTVEVVFRDRLNLWTRYVYKVGP